MDNLSSLTLWDYQEHQQTLVELKDKLLATILELEEVKNTAREEIQKREDNINQLIQLVKAADQERDEARDQLQMLLNKLRQPLGSSSITESEYLSDAQNNYSHVSSPAVVDSFIDASFSPQLSDVNIADSCNVMVPPATTQEDLMAAVFDRFAKKPLPVKGRLLEAVMNAGPILDTLFIAGSLPQWRNPPPMKPLLVPPISIRCGDGFMLRQNAALNPSYLLQNCNAASQATTASPMPSYGSGAVCKENRPLMAHCAGIPQSLAAKSQRSK